MFQMVFFDAASVTYQFTGNSYGVYSKFLDAFLQTGSSNGAWKNQ